MTLTDNSEIKNIFEGIVSNLKNYESRPQQVIMAESIQKSFNDRKSSIIEAGTGSGKSFGYLIPAVDSNLKVVISTGTIALQEQLLNKDIPFVVDQFNKDVRYALAKGRRNYLCKQKLFEATKTIPPQSKEGKIISKINKLLFKSWSGDAAELDIVIPDLIWSEINSDKDDCLHQRCEYFSDCPFRLARAELAKADIIVANHALYFTDLACGGTILPGHDFVIFDEAHHIKNIATRAFTVSIGKWSSSKLMQKIQKRISPIPDFLIRNITDIETKVLSWLLSKNRETFKIFSDSELYDLVSSETHELNRLRSWLNDFEVEQQDLFADNESLKKESHKDRLISQTSNLISKWEYFAEQEVIKEEERRVNWAEINKNTLSFEINSAPIFIANSLKENLWEKTPAILTSATLAIDKNCNYTKKQLGIEADELILESPFEYSTQARLYLPKINSEPNSREYNISIAKEITKLVKTSEGRALVLFTSISAMKDVSAAVIEHVEYPCKIQGDLTRNKLIKWFKETDNSILFATATYWEGIDIPGEDLSCVIIDKIPFYAPDDPIVSATVDLMKSKNQSWFMDFMLPEAALKLKQGFGRLIRTKEDKGLIAILDPRLLSKSYGRIILNSLPKTPIINVLDDVESFFEEIKMEI